MRKTIDKELLNYVPILKEGQQAKVPDYIKSLLDTEVESTNKKGLREMTANAEGSNRNIEVERVQGIDEFEKELGGKLTGTMKLTLTHRSRESLCDELPLRHRACRKKRPVR